MQYQNTGALLCLLSRLLLSSAYCDTVMVMFSFMCFLIFLLSLSSTDDEPTVSKRNRLYLLQ